MSIPTGPHIQPHGKKGVFTRFAEKTACYTGHPAVFSCSLLAGASTATRDPEGMSERELTSIRNEYEQIARDARHEMRGNPKNPAAKPPLKPLFLLGGR
jgi:hypothetical protein